MIDVRWVTGFLDSPSPASESFWCAVTGSVLSADALAHLVGCEEHARSRLRKGAGGR